MTWKMTRKKLRQDDNRQLHVSAPPNFFGLNDSQTTTPPAQRLTRWVMRDGKRSALVTWRRSTGDGGHPVKSFRETLQQQATIYVVPYQVDSTGST